MSLIRLMGEDGGRGGCDAVVIGAGAGAGAGVRAGVGAVAGALI